MSLKTNISASYASQIYVALVGIVMVPMYVSYMGVEAYGLVGFFAMLQVWFQLLDMGLTPTMARETARYQGGAIKAIELYRLLRALERVFVGVAFLGGGALAMGTGVIASSWLNIDQLPIEVVHQSLMLMSVIVALRWICGLYRGAINGFEKIVWLSGFNSAIATARFVLIIPFFIYVGTSPVEFFCYQLVVAIVELIVLVAQTYRLMPRLESGTSIGWELGPLRRVLKFSISVAFTSSVWVFVTQTDKLIMSKLLSLTEYAHYTLAVLAASGVLILSTAISGALTPRLTKLNAKGNEEGFISVYRGATQLVAIIVFPVSFLMVFFAEELLWVWTGDVEIARVAAPVMTLYVLGNAVLTLGGFPYYMQYAKGDLKLHLIGSVLFIGILMPSLFFFTARYGMIGPGIAWFGTHLILFVFWLPRIHKRFYKSLHSKWIFRDIAPILIISLLTSMSFKQWVVLPDDRLSLMVWFSGLGVALFLVSSSASSMARAFIMNRWRLGSANESR